MRRSTTGRRTTVALIVLNVGAYALARSHWEAAKPWMLAYGTGLHPIQWLTYTFLHPGIPTLVANMVYLWMFGMIVEGKLGNFKFLATYLGLAAIQGMLEQGVFFVSAKGYGLGTTTMIFALMAMAVVWAPKNDVSCIWFGFTIKPIDLPVLGLTAFYVVCELILVGLLGLAGVFLHKALMHLLGGLLGFALATALLKSGVVDCEGWDLFSVLKGDHTRSRKKKTTRVTNEWGEEVEKVEESEVEAPKPGALRIEALTKLKAAVDQEHAPAALALYRKFVERKTGWWAIPESEHLALIKLLLRERLGQELVPILERYVSRFPGESDPLRLVLARVLIRDQQRPAHGARILSTVACDRLSRAMKDLHQQLIDEAAQMREEGVLELEGEGW